MRIIYINIGGSLKVSSIYKKIQGQVNAFANNGVDCKGYFLSTEVSKQQAYSENIDFVPVKKSLRKYFPQLQQQTNYLNSLETLLKKESFDYVYLRFPFSHPKLLSILKQYPKKVIIEFNSISSSETRSHSKNKHYDGYISGVLSKLQDIQIPIFYDWLLMTSIVNQAKLIVGVTSELVEFYKTKKSDGIAIPNGIDVSLYATRISPSISKSKIIMLILDGTSTDAPWQGMDRLIKSIRHHKLENNLEVWICSDKNEYASLPFIKELGYLNGEKLTNLFNSVHFGSGKFSTHRSGIKDISALKSREYISRGLPLAYAGNDSDIENSDLNKYAYKIPNDESIINLPDIIKWICKLYENRPNHAEEMKELAYKKLSFDIKISELLTYLKKE